MKFNPDVLKTINTEDLTQFFYEPDPMAPGKWYLMLRLVDAFYRAHKRYPGVKDDQVEGDVEAMVELLEPLLADLGLGVEAREEAGFTDFITEKHIREM